VTVWLVSSAFEGETHGFVDVVHRKHGRNAVTIWSYVVQSRPQGRGRWDNTLTRWAHFGEGQPEDTPQDMMTVGHATPGHFYLML
jgi:hypothetical protein